MWLLVMSAWVTLLCVWESSVTTGCFHIDVYVGETVILTDLVALGCNRHWITYI